MKEYTAPTVTDLGTVAMQTLATTPSTHEVTVCKDNQVTVDSSFGFGNIRHSGAC